MSLNVHWRIPFLNLKFFIHTCCLRVEIPNKMLLITSAGISNGSLINIVVEKLHWFLRSSRRKNPKRNGRGWKGKCCNGEGIWNEKIIAGGHVVYVLQIVFVYSLTCVVLELCESFMGRMMSRAGVKVVCSQGRLKCMELFSKK